MVSVAQSSNGIMSRLETTPIAVHLHLLEGEEEEDGDEATEVSGTLGEEAR